VVIHSYGGRVADMWWDQVGGKLERIKNLTVVKLPVASSQGLAKLAQRNMQLQCTIQDGQIWVRDQDSSLQVELVLVKSALARR